VRHCTGFLAPGCITNSPINIYNRDPEEIERLAQQLDRSEGDRRAAETKAAELARQLDLSNVTTQTVVGFLRILAHQPDLNLEQVPAKMAEITASYVQMQARLAALSQAEARETAAIDEHRVAAELRAARGENAATQLHYTDGPALRGSGRATAAEHIARPP
jgi:hypothetical protein